MNEKIVRILKGLINMALWLAEVFLIMRFILRLFGANPAATFIKFIYDASDSISKPFLGAFSSPIIDKGMTLDLSTLLAITIYALAAYFIIEFINWVSKMTGRE
jgi:YggT family protein